MARNFSDVEIGCRNLVYPRVENVSVLTMAVTDGTDFTVLG